MKFSNNTILELVGEFIEIKICIFKKKKNNYKKKLKYKLEKS